MSVKVFLPSLLVLALSACAVGPDYKTPATEPAQISADNLKGFDRAHFEGIWWQQFDDHETDRLTNILRVFSQNCSVL